MSIEDWMMSLPPCMGGKRPRSPVEKLADLQGQAEAEDEDNWRNSKRYLSEVIANGFSRLNFGLQRPHGSEQQQLDPQMLSLASPRGPGGCYIQLPGGMLSPRDGGDWDMEMESPPGCPGSSSSAGNAAAATGQRTSRSPSGKGNRPIIVTEMLAGQSGSPMCSPAGGGSASSPGHYPFSSYVSPGAKPLPPPAWQVAAGAAGAAAGTAGAAGPTPAAGTASPALPKGLKAAEKAPNSPSDLPASGSNLRKVALLRSLLARTEQHLQQQQQQHGQLPHEQQHGHQQHQQQAHAGHQQAPGSLQQHNHEQQQQQQQHQYGPAGPVVYEQERAAAEGVHVNAAAQHGCAQQHGQHGQVGRQGLVSAGAAAQAAGPTRNISGAVATAYQQGACSTHSDDMECSSSSMCDSDSDVHQPRGRFAASASDADLATSSLLCTEVLPLSGTELPSRRQQQQQNGAWLQHNLAACEQQHHSYVAGCDPAQYGAQLPSHMGQTAPWVQPQHNMVQHGPQQQPQQQLLQHPMPQQQQQLRPLELSAERLQQLRAKALASTSRLTELEPEDLASLQLSISASQARRGSADHTPSHLHSARAAAERGGTPATSRTAVVPQMGPTVMTETGITE